MTNRKAIEILREKISPCVFGEWKESVDAAISALEKQIPMKPQNIHRFRGREKCVGTCPTCGYVCCSDYGGYCGGCAQAIDWTEGE